jgi:hypothetical protein
MQDASEITEVRSTLRAAPPAPPLGAVDVRTVGIGSLAAAVTAWYAWQRYGLARAGLFGLGLLLGVALFHARFGFVSAWRQLVAVGQGRGLQAHALMIGTASLLFSPILARGEGGAGGDALRIEGEQPAQVDGAAGVTRGLAGPEGWWLDLTPSAAARQPYPRFGITWTPPARPISP